METAQKNVPRCGQNSPYLYRKRGFFYYRFRLPKNICNLDRQPEVRISLRTSYKKYAQQIVLKLHSWTVATLTSWEPEANLDEQFSRLKEGLQQKLEEILKGEQKNPVTIPEITSRLDQHLQQKLEDDELSTTAYSVTIEKENSEKEKIDLKNVYEGVAKKIAGEIHSAENFENWSLVAIFEMLDKGILKPEEISSDNFMEIAKSYHKYESIFNKGS